MDKKVKSLDITTLLSLVFYIAGIAFCVMGYIFMNKADVPFDLSNIDLADDSGSGIAKLLFIVGCVFAGLGIISGIVVGVFYLTTDWGDEELKKKTKLAGILNLLPICLSIPANIVTRSLVKEFVHDEQKPKKNKKTSKEVSSATQPQQTTSTPTATNISNTTTQTNTGFGSQASAGFGVQPTNYAAPGQTTHFVAPVNQSFQYNGKWMYFDGVTYYEADANNQWVVSSIIPQ